MAGSFGLMGVPKIGYAGISTILEENIKHWLNVSFLEMGAYSNISKDQLNYNGTNLSELRTISDAVYGDGYVYKSYFSNWVWENDIQEEQDYDDIVVCSGIWVGGDFYPKETSGNMAYHIDYVGGRVIFDTYLAPEQVYGTGDMSVFAEFSYKRIYVATDTDLKNIATESSYMTNPIGSGEEFLDSSKVPLPLVSIAEKEAFWEPYELGGHKKYLSEVSIEVIATNRKEGALITDILSQQENKKLPSIDWNSSESPFDEYGDINPLFSGVYDVTSIYPWKHVYLIDSSSQKNNGDLFYGNITFNFEIDSFI